LDFSLRGPHLNYGTVIRIRCAFLLQRCPRLFQKNLPFQNFRKKHARRPTAKESKTPEKYGSVGLQGRCK
jgi:hypothetical protein